MASPKRAPTHFPHNYPSPRSDEIFMTTHRDPGFPPSSASELPNPYAAPQGAPSRAPVIATGAYVYVPLGWRTILASLSVAGLAVSSPIFHALEAALGARTKDPNDLAAALLVALSALAMLGTLFAGALFVLLWIHRASMNLRGLGRFGMRNSPGACIAGFFIPIASLWMPLSAMTEIWRASDPDRVEGTWLGSKATPLLGVWWVSWVITCVMDVFSRFAEGNASIEATWGLASDVPRALAAVALVFLMRGISARQEQAARALRT
jgi:hypothetical protein